LNYTVLKAIHDVTTQIHWNTWNVYIQCNQWTSCTWIRT